MRQKQRKDLVLNNLIFIGLMALGILVPAAQAELATGSDVLPVYRGDLENSQSASGTAGAVAERDSAELPLQVASRLTNSGEDAGHHPVATASGNEFFNETPPLITLGEYIRSGYLTTDHKPMGQIIRNDNFSTNAVTTEVVNLDFGTNKGVKPGDRFLAYTVNDNFNRGYDFETPVNHPVISDQGKIREERIPNDLWDLQIGPGETGVWRKKLQWFDDLMLAKGEKQGNMIRVVGVLEALESDTERTRAVVVEMIELIPRGAYVVPFPKNLPAMLKQDQKNAAKNLSGYVLDNREGYLLGSERDIVYIDLGKADNLEPGDRFEVLAASKEEKLVIRSLIRELEPIWEPKPRTMLDRHIGELVVIKVGDKSSTAMIVDGDEPILPGHRIMSKH